MPPWLQHIKSAQRKESNLNSSRWVQLATVGVDNTPRVRTVVFRGWSKSYEMEIYTDKRSQKYYELEINNNVEICWLFSKSKCQYRFRGTSRIALDKEKLSYWENLSDKSKSMWSWPSPGSNFHIKKNKDLSARANEFPLINFVALKIDVNYVDQLVLERPIHTRRRWIRKNDWFEERINP
tara:strand:- start:365 stop:907 length:543 start_codon:yes stop_codon:yes gene_type:complete